ncbi:uncharacterized protein PITG_10566 [Phytophthora infestans T30-4]|uniref:Uncharacterized protein n=2 Tax=Phytophthora infestans TaxID=4787 RepID=D0NFM2_PHYIT|nr:uncharacterized protein PITG_10566 [Phytophthora infestans T30-4]EEY57011.1 hypothetical protein PITG_10566 [Phytophthora infestans T30-4]KAF4149450.1 hypothetical protein GN958_ATG01422 [Phytophthora infestans]|eukprot:XP_002902339.1 hypothetical protein PITG_10566 [Phytophthora infestans T30-4]
MSGVMPAFSASCPSRPVVLTKPTVPPFGSVAKAKLHQRIWLRLLQHHKASAVTSVPPAASKATSTER